MLPHICYVNHPLDLTLYKVIYGRCHIYIDIDMHVFFFFCKVSAMSPFPVAAPTLHFQLPLQLFISSCRSSSSFPVAACGWRRLWLARSSPAAVPPLAAAAALDAARPGRATQSINAVAICVYHLTVFVRVQLNCVCWRHFLILRHHGQTRILK